MWPVAWLISHPLWEWACSGESANSYEDVCIIPFASVFRQQDSGHHAQIPEFSVEKSSTSCFTCAVEVRKIASWKLLAEMSCGAETAEINENKEYSKYSSYS